MFSRSYELSPHKILVSSSPCPRHSKNTTKRIPPRPIRLGNHNKMKIMALPTKFKYDVHWHACKYNFLHVLLFLTLVFIFNFKSLSVI